LFFFFFLNGCAFGRVAFSPIAALRLYLSPTILFCRRVSHTWPGPALHLPKLKQAMAAVAFRHHTGYGLARACAAAAIAAGGGGGRRGLSSADRHAGRGHSSSTRPIGHGRQFSTASPRHADFTHAVVGGGVVGLAIARKLQQRDGVSTVVIERHGSVGTETSSRNSEVRFIPLLCSLLLSVSVQNETASAQPAKPANGRVGRFAQDGYQPQSSVDARSRFRSVARPLVRSFALFPLFSFYFLLLLSSRTSVRHTFSQHNG